MSEYVSAGRRETRRNKLVALAKVDNTFYKHYSAVSWMPPMWVFVADLDDLSNAERRCWLSQSSYYGVRMIVNATCTLNLSKAMSYEYLRF